MNALRSGLQNRFPFLTSFQTACTSAKSYVIAAIAHPFFRLRWIDVGDVGVAENLFLVALHQNAKTVKERKARTENESATNVATPDVSACNDDEFYGFANEAHNESAALTTEGIAYLRESQYSKDFMLLKKYPNVANLFVATNTTPASSAPVERLFSSAGRIFEPRRNRLSDNRFENLLLLKKTLLSCKPSPNSSEKSNGWLRLAIQIIGIGLGLGLMCNVLYSQ